MRCSVPGKVAGHKSSTVKGDRSMKSKESSFIAIQWGSFILLEPVSNLKFAEVSAVETYS